MPLPAALLLELRLREPGQRGIDPVARGADPMARPGRLEWPAALEAMSLFGFASRANSLSRLRFAGMPTELERHDRLHGGVLEATGAVLAAAAGNSLVE